MKRSKTFRLLLLITLALLAAGVGAMLYRAVQATGPADRRPQAETPMTQAETPDLPHYAIVTSGAETPHFIPEAPDLSEKLKRAAIRTVLATLPEGSSVQGQVQLNLTKKQSAQVTGTVLTPPGNHRPERQYRFQIGLDFLPTGDSECAFPEFTEQNQP